MYSRSIFARIAFLAVVVFGVVAVRPAVAQDARFRRLVREGLSAYQAGEWSTARAIFEEAHALRPTAEALRMMGNASFELEDYQSAVRYFDMALGFDLRPLDERAQSEATRARDAALEFVAVLRIELYPETAEVLLDGRPLGSSELAHLVLEPGHYTIRVRALGYVPDEREIEITTGEVREAFSLLPEGAAESGTSDAVYFDEDGREIEEPREPINPWVWGGIAIGVVVAGAAAGAGYGIYAVNESVRENRFVTPTCDGGECVVLGPVQVLRVGF